VRALAGLCARTRGSGSAGELGSASTAPGSPRLPLLPGHALLGAGLGLVGPSVVLGGDLGRWELHVGSRA